MGDVRTPLITGMTATRAHWLEWVQAQGLVALQRLHEGLVELLDVPHAPKPILNRTRFPWTPV